MDSIHYYATRRAARSTADKLNTDPTAVLTLMSIHELGGEVLSHQLYAITGVDGARVRDATYTLEKLDLIKRLAKDGKPARPGITSKAIITPKGIHVAELAAELVQSIMTSILDDTEHGLEVAEAAS